MTPRLAGPNWRFLLRCQRQLYIRKNKVNKFKGTDKGGISYDGANIIWEGHSINSQYLLRADRIIQTDADLALVQQMIDNAPIDEKTGKKGESVCRIRYASKRRFTVQRHQWRRYYRMDDREIVSDGPNRNSNSV